MITEIILKLLIFINLANIFRDKKSPENLSTMRFFSVFGTSVFSAEDGT